MFVLNLIHLYLSFPLHPHLHRAECCCHRDFSPAELRLWIKLSPDIPTITELVLSKPESTFFFFRIISLIPTCAVTFHNGI